MWGRNRSPVQESANTIADTLSDMKTGAVVEGVKGAAAGALGALGSKISDSTDGDLGKKARKAQKNVLSNLSSAADTAQQRAQKAAKKADVQSKASAAGSILQALGERAGKTAKDATGSGWNINIDIEDVPRLLRGVTLVATGLGTLFAPGSPLDASKRRTGDTSELVGQTREGIDTAASMTQQRIKDLVDLAKDALATLSDTLQEGIETAEKQAQRALDDTEKNLTRATQQAAKSAKSALPKQKKGGSFRWLFFGLLAGGTVAYLSSPLSGSLGERINNLRRDLGLGGDEDDDSQYWPSPPPAATTTESGGTPSMDATSPSGMKTEEWSSPSDAKEGTDKV